VAAKKPLLLLFDGHALVHRAYHALPPLSVSKTGELVNAVYGFASMLLKVLKEFKPSHYAIAFDRPTPTFRHERFQDYKANRPPAPEELRAQFRRVRELVEAFHIPVYEIDGFEADDVLGTLSRQASQRGMDTVIVTGDTDTMQLVSPQVRILTSRPGKRFGDTMVYDEAQVQQKYGVAPSQIADLKALIGDPSDNIPGVPGVGQKTALKLIQQFGSVENLLDHLDEVTPEKLQETLRHNEELLRQGKELATIVTDVPMDLDLDKCSISGFERDRVVALFRELEFNTQLPKLNELELGQEQATTPQIKAPLEGRYHTITSGEALADLVLRLGSAPGFAFDTETTSKQAMLADLVGISISPYPGEAYYIPVGHQGLGAGPQLPLELVLDQLRPLLQDPDLPKVAHNAKYDMAVLARYGVQVRNLACDTMIAAYLLNEHSLGLKALAFSRLGVEMKPISELLGSGAKQLSMEAVDICQAAEYACADADVTRRLKEPLELELKEQGLWKLFTQVEMPLVPVLLEMEQNGVAIDTALLREMSQSLGRQLSDLEASIYENVGYRFNINSSQQLGAVLFDQLKLPRSRRTKSGYSTEAAVLESLKGLHPVVELILEYRQIAKLKSTYLDALPGLINPETGRIHSTFNQTGTATGRLSSSDPNLQNIPIRTELGKQIRQAFIAQPPAWLLAPDYSQIDLRVLAHLSGDPGLKEAFRRDEDIHTTTAAQVFGIAMDQVTPEMRRVAKTVNFGVIYGMSDYGLEQATELSRHEAAQFIAAYFERYPGVKGYLESTKEQARNSGYVETLLGRRRYIPEIGSSNRMLREAAERMAINMPVQGTSADIIKVAMLRLHEAIHRRGLKSRLILQVHDELLFEAPPEELEEMKSLVSEIMPHALELSVPLKIDIKVGRNWGELE